MRLFEFSNNEISVQIAIIADELKTALDNKELPDTISTDDLIMRFKKGGVPIDKEQLANLVQVPPLSDVIDNMNFEEVTFKGSSSDNMDLEDESDQEKVVAQMAKKAMKN
jgi:hypothetical protein